VKNNPPIELQNAVQKLLHDFSPADLVLVGCSGGADSLSLAWCTQVVGKRLDLKVGAVIIDHQLFTNSAEVANKAKEQCVDLDLDPVIIKKVDVEKTNEGIEAAARVARYKAFEEILKETNATALLLAHTQDDQAETILMRLSRGSGAKSLSGMQAVNGKYLRPFLHIRKKIVHESLKLINLEPWQDPANNDNQFLRVKVRNELMPKLIEVLGDSAINSLDKTSQLLRDDNQALEEIAQNYWNTNSEVKTMGLNVLDIEKMPKAIRTRIVKIAALEAGAIPGPLTFEHIEAIDALITNWHGQGNVDLPGFIHAQRSDGRIKFQSSKL